MEKKLVILTGTIGSGKSTVLSRLRTKGCTTFSADETVHSLLDTDAAVHEELVKHFGQEVMSSGKANRKWLAQRVFQDGQAKQLLESILHPRVRQIFLRYLAEHDWKTPLVYEVPLYFETAPEYPLTPIVVVVTAPEERVIERLSQQRGISEADYQRRKATQLPEEEKISRADFVLRNDGTLAEFYSQIDELADKLCSLPLMALKSTVS